MRFIALIARREIAVRLRQKGFRIGLAATLVLIAVACALPSLLSGSGTTTYDIALTGQTSQPLKDALTAAAGQRGAKVKFHAAGVDEARHKVSTGDWDVALVDSRQLIAKRADSAAVNVVQVAYESVQLLVRLRADGLSDGEARQALSVEPLPVSAASSDDTTQRQVIATIAVVVLFGQLITYCTWVANGVVEEKSSRVVELLLSAVRPVQLLAGKLLGIGGLAVGQVALLGIVALASAKISGSLTLAGPAYLSVLVAFIGFVFGFAFFASLAATLASTVSRQEELGGILAPMSILLMLSYFASFAAASAPESTVARVLSIMPPVSALAMPARVAQGGVPVLDVVAAVLFMVAATAMILLLASRIYRAAILHTGNKLPLRAAWRGEAVAEID